MSTRSSQSRRSSCAARAFFLVAALAGVPRVAAALDANRQSELTVLVRQDCGSCHGMTLKGGLGKPLLPETLAALEVDSIAAIILDGVPGQPMPPWKGLISAEDAAWIAAKLKQGFPQ